MCGRKQRVKLARDCVSEWGAVPSGVPQGTKLGPWLFILMISDLKLADITHWKYIDDTTVSEIIPRNGISQIQSEANELERWNTQNKFQLNVQKCNELLFQFHRNRMPFDRINLSTGCPNSIRQAKILGVTVRDDLRWSTHIFNIIRKANKRVFFIVQLKRTKIPSKEIVNFYCCCVRPVLGYACEVFYFALPKYLSDNIERVQRRITSIIFPDLSYSERLEKANLTLLSDRRWHACLKLFNQITKGPAHKLSNSSQTMPSHHLYAICMQLTQ